MYLPISDYAAVGDPHTAALISSQGSIDWMCLPHFDSPAVFLRLLDDNKGGCCELRLPQGTTARRRYLARTNILETTFETAGGRLVVTDFMPARQHQEDHWAGQDATTDHRIIRLLRCAEGVVDFAVEIHPTFSFATERVDAVAQGEGVVVFRARNDALHAQCARLAPESGGRAVARLHLAAGEAAALVLTHAKPDEQIDRPDVPDVQRTLDETRAYWEKWSGACSYAGEYKSSVLRSALALKLLTFEPTGAIVAAPTTSLPEQIGGVRNWDYRFTWLRDATFTLMALMNLDYLAEAHDFLHFLHHTCNGAADDIQILYSINGERAQEERTLDHLAGYRGSRPVRVGNAAAGQKQLDVYGEIVQCIYLYASHGGFDRFHESMRDEVWWRIETIADYVSEHWRDPDSGIWEVRGDLRHFVHSKAMCWVALDCALRLAAMAKANRDISAWERARRAILESVLRDGFNPNVGAFVQAYGSTALDASVLRLPMLGVVRATDPKMRSTIEQIERHLVRNGLVYRYRDAGDGIHGGEGTFTICTFWLIENYVMLDRLREAEELFRHVLSFQNDVGLFAEEIDPATGEQLGNFPQAFTHIALINAAVAIAGAKQGTKSSAHAVVQRTGGPRAA